MKNNKNAYENFFDINKQKKSCKTLGIIGLIAHTINLLEFFI